MRDLRARTHDDPHQRESGACHSLRSPASKRSSGRRSIGRKSGGFSSRRPDADRKQQAAADRLLPWRSDRRRDLRSLAAVHAHGGAGRSLSGRSAGRRPGMPCSCRCHAADPGTAKKGTAPSSTPGARPTTATSWPVSTISSRRASLTPIAWGDGRVVRRLHDQLDRDADQPVQGRVRRARASAISPICTTLPTPAR